MSVSKKEGQKKVSSKWRASRCASLQGLQNVSKVSSAVNLPLEKPHKHQETWTALPTSPVVLPRNLHLQTMSVPGWTYSSDHTQQCQMQQSSFETGKKQELDYKRVLMRVLHLYESGEDPELSKPTTINLKELLRSIGEVSEVRERSLTGTWDISDLHRWKWQTSQEVDHNDDARTSNGVSEDFSVTISPKEIRTFFVRFK